MQNEIHPFIPKSYCVEILNNDKSPTQNENSKLLKENNTKDKYVIYQAELQNELKEIEKRYEQLILEKIKIYKDLNLFTKIIKEKYDESTEGATISAYYGEGILKKIEGVYYGEIGKTTINYYCIADRLIFISKKKFIYDNPIPNKNTKVISIRKNNYYFNKNMLFKWISDSTEISPKTEKFDNENKFWIQDFNETRNFFIGK
ncbi:MAG: hypothetical protein Q8M94_10950 [Ignavibacteria bacterium]|nr:hypothetical protein [Ignavibacteria bacterium]